MGKHKCETCRFYREAGLAGSGWCHHPERRTSTNTLIMVRRGELACRDDWDHDLWTPQLPKKSDNDRRGDDAALARPERPATSAEIAAVARLRLEPEPGTTSPVQEDVVVGQAPIMPSPEDRAALLAYDTRTAIVEARERARRRLAAQAAELAATSGADAVPAEAEPPAATEPHGQTHEEPTAALASTTTSPLAADRLVVARDDYDGGESSETAAFLAGLRPQAVEPRPDRFESIPEVVPDIELPRAEPRPSRVRVSNTDILAVGEDEAAWHDPPFGNDIRRGRLLNEVLRRRAAAEAQGRQAERRGQASEAAERRARTRPPLHDRATPMRVPPVPRDEVAGRRAGSFAAGLPTEPVVAVPAERTTIIESPRVEAARPAWRGESFVSEPDPELEPESAPELDDMVVGALDEIEAEPLAVAGRDEYDDEVLDVTVQVSPQVPRMCRTCRDFRPAESGDRGWCTNRWAFSHRRMVYEDEVPCRTTLGCWWLPHDDIWLATADVSAHSQPTPLLDRWLGDGQDAAEAEAAGDGRRGPLKRQRS